MEEYYPYTVIPQKVKSIINEQIPLPKLPKLLPSPDKVKRGYVGTVIFILAIITFILVNVVPALKNIYAIYALFFISLIALVAMIFEFVQYGKLKKHYDKEMRYYNERQRAYRKVKQEIDEIEKNNSDSNKVNVFRQKKIHSFFQGSYDTINATHNEYSPAKKRFKLFLEEYFPDEILDNIKVVHRAKKINYIPDFVIQFKNPKISISIEIEEPYSLSNIPENIQKDYDAKDRLRQRFANELGWLVIILSEEQAVLNPNECCRFIEDSMSEILNDIKPNTKFANISPIKRQKVLNGKERAELKANKYRETYLTNAGLMDKIIVNSDNKSISLKNTSASKEKEKTRNGVSIPNVKNKKEKLPEKADVSTTESKEKKLPIKTDKNVKITRIEKYEKQTNDSENKSENNVKKVTSIENKDERAKTKKINETLTSKDNKNIEAVKNDDLKKQDRVKEKSIDLTKKRSPEKKTFGTTVKADTETKKDSKSIEEIIRRRKLDIQQKLKNKLDDTPTKTEDTDKKKTNIDVKKPYTEKTSTEIKEKIEKNLNVTNKSAVKSEKLEVKVVKNGGLDSNQDVKVETVVIETKKTDSKENKVEVSKPTSNREKEDKSLTKTQSEKELIDSHHKKLESAVFDKKWDELINLCDKAIEELPSWYWAYYRRSTALGYKREFEKAILDCDKAINLQNDFAEAYYNRATANYFLNKYADAVKDYDRAIYSDYIKPEEAHFNKGLCLYKLFKFDDAYNEFVKAEKLGCQKSAEIIKDKFSE